MNIFKLLIPTGEKKAIKELESWTVKWKVYNRIDFTSYASPETFFKTFIDEREMAEFKKQLKECADFVKTPIKIESYKN